MKTVIQILAILGFAFVASCETTTRTTTTESTYVPGVGTVTEQETTTTYDD